ncbi:diacylglycerol/lipid kinase family protein [Neolewinella persica]|uniref:diacylglycerol/lipid kinase family protein n=1 Tax=Neolewinella persica TaxID=70998 RepID=UPI0003750C46|nr:diacylglycerol kinase family protein [Neolewinella persica]
MLLKHDLWRVTTDKTSWHFIINPGARRGKAAERWKKIMPKLRAALPEMTVAQSNAGNSLALLAETAVREGHTRLVGVGGDGTHHHIINGIVAAGKLDRVIYVPLPLGTGNDWVRTLKTPRNIDRWLEMLHQEKTMLHAVGKLRFTPQDGQPADGLSLTAFFLNVAGMAYDAEVVRRSEKARFRHRLIYPFLTLLYLRDFTAPYVRIDYDGVSFTGPVHTINFGIGRYSGGGMRLVPHADPERETLALTFARRLSTLKILLESWRFYAGSIDQVKDVTTAHVKTVTVMPVTGTAELEADGEWLGVAPVEVSLLGDRLRVVVV